MDLEQSWESWNWGEEGVTGVEVDLEREASVELEGIMAGEDAVWESTSWGSGISGWYWKVFWVSGGLDRIGTVTT